MACPPGFFEGPGASGEVGAPSGPARSLPQSGRGGCGFDPVSFLSSEGVCGSLGAWPKALRCPGSPRGSLREGRLGTCLKAGLEPQREILVHLKQFGLSHFPLSPSRGRRGVG